MSTYHNICLYLFLKRFDPSGVQVRQIISNNNYRNNYSGSGDDGENINLQNESLLEVVFRTRHRSPFFPCSLGSCV